MLNDLALRAIACDDWKWMAGMRLTTGYRLTDDDVELRDTLTNAWRPDFNDPLTSLAVLVLVREAWGTSMATAYFAPLSCGQGWYVAARFAGALDQPFVPVPSAWEAEALVVALESAP